MVLINTDTVFDLTVLLCGLQREGGRGWGGRGLAEKA